MWTKQDREQISARGSSLNHVEQQIKTFEQGIPFVKLQKPCALGDGITELQNPDIMRFSSLFEGAQLHGRVIKFVPASGAASRMFQSLLACMKSHDKQTGHPEDQHVTKFWGGIKRFAFYDALKAVMADQALDIEELLTRRESRTILQHLLTPVGLNYANLPKGLLQFHQYADHCRTPLEEHLVEAAAYTQDVNHVARIHFTTSQRHQDPIRHHLEDVRKRHEQSGIRFNLTLSVQKSSTDTIAVDRQNQPIRDKDGNLVFRPAGHGALLENLNDLQGDMIFIKNIDNVVPDHLKSDIYTYKKALGGHFLSVQRLLFTYLQQLASSDVNEEQLDDMKQFAQETLSIAPPKEFPHWSKEEQLSFLFKRFNRPLRVCGMVQHTGEPGGRPFWVEHPDGSCSLQIVEASQIDPESSEQQRIFRSATYCNPVDLVCGVRNYLGKAFDLTQFVDPNAGFIVQKSYKGHSIKALELPGLWNGSMAQWNTIFVEVPRTTFSPVKSVNDLLKPEHQPG